MVELTEEFARFAAPASYALAHPDEDVLRLRSGQVLGLRVSWSLVQHDQRSGTLAAFRPSS
jgi:hypothetical protein